MDKKALGKGLSALIPEKEEAIEASDVRQIYTNSIDDNRLQPRTNYDQQKLDELISSIKEKGVLQPILVREQDGRFEVVAGERRLRAARALKLEKVPVIVKDLNDKEALVIALVENIQREELNAIEEAKAFKKLIDEFDYSQEEVAHSVGKDRSTVTNFLRLLKLPAEIQQQVYDGKLSVGHARTLLGLNAAYDQMKLCQLALNKNLSVRELERLVSKRGEAPTKRKKSSEKSHDVLALEEELQMILGTKVSVQSKKKRGKIVIEYYSLDDLDRILKTIKGRS